MTYLIIYQYLWFGFWIALFVKWGRSFEKSSSFLPLALSIAFGIAIIEIMVWKTSPLEFRSGAGYLMTKTLRTTFANFVLVSVGCTLAAERLKLYDGDQLMNRVSRLLITKSPDWWKATTLSCMAVVGFSYLWFWLALPNASVVPEEPVSELLVVKPLVYFGPILLAAIIEELAFRFALQNWLIRVFGGNRRAHVLAAILVTLFWTIGHAGVVDPNWVKFTQIATIGILLSFLNVRYGIISCLMVHLCLNGILQILTSSLINR